MKAKIRDEKEFEKLLDALLRDIVSAHMHYRLFRDLQGARKEYALEFNQSKAFWHLTFRAHQEVAIIHACRAYDQHENCLSLKALLGTIRDNLGIFDTPRFRERLKGNPFVDSLVRYPHKPDKTQLENDLRYASPKTNPLVQRLVTLRSNHYMHRNVKPILKQTKSAQLVTWVEFEELLREALTIANRYSSLFRASSHSSQLMGHDDYRHLLESIRSDVKRKREEWESILKRKPSG